MYKNLNVLIPSEKRELFNNKIINLIKSENLKDISKEEIFNVYTGKGGLHGLEYNDYNSYHDYTEAKKELEQGQFFTPAPLCEKIIEIIKPSSSDLVADLCCGSGNFFNYIKEQENIFGCELDNEAFKVANFLYPDANIDCVDLRFYEPQTKLDLVVGNPPFNLSWKVKGESILSQLFYCEKAASLLKSAGLLIFIAPSSFLADEFANKTMIEKINRDFNFVGQLYLDPKGFKHLGVDHFNTKLIVLQKKSVHLPEVPFNTFKFSANFEDLQVQIEKVKESKNKVQSKILMELNQSEGHNNWSFKNQFDNLDTQEIQLGKEKIKVISKGQNLGFEFKVKKYLFEIKTHPSINKHYPKVLGYLEQFQTQCKPEGMEWEEWNKIKITPNKVIAYLKNTLKKQVVKKKIDKIRLVKTNYGFKLKAYSPKFSRKLPSEKNWTLYNLIYFPDNKLPIDSSNKEERAYQKLIDKKRAKFIVEETAYPKMNCDSDIESYLNKFTFLKNDNEVCHFLPKQKHDINLTIQKQYSFLNWQQGAGKTASTFAWGTYRLIENKVKNVFVVAPALAIQLTWKPFLKLQGGSFLEIRKFSDIANIKEGDFVLVSLSMINKLQRKLKGFIKSKSQKVAMIFDESDEITNVKSINTKAVQNVFRRAQFKINATGTATRNNVNELYPQMELLYNNSVNMMSTCYTIYKQNNKSKEVEELKNPMYMQPYSARYGFGLFKASFNPAKSTVFGIKKHNQDMLNIDHLRSLIEKMIITRKFKDLAGVDKYEVHSDRLVQNENEREVYRVIIEEFYQILSNYFTSTGNSRKDSGLRIIRQLRSLIKATSMPQSYKEYPNKNIRPTKCSKIMKMVEDRSMVKVCIGCTTKEASKFYLKEISSNFFRPVFYIDGDINFNKRKKILKEFEATANGILICTQQSLKSSINIPSCNEVILESLQWNFPKMEQFYFRFIRLDSKEKTNVHMVTYDDTIEQNILALLLKKEQINDFIKELEYKPEGDIYEEYGVDMGILDSIIEKEYDEDGGVTINWGKQEVA